MFHTMHHPDGLFCPICGCGEIIYWAEILKDWEQNMRYALVADMALKISRMTILHCVETECDIPDFLLHPKRRMKCVYFG